MSKHALCIESIETGATVANDGTGLNLSTTHANFIVYSIDGERKWCISVAQIVSVAGINASYIDTTHADESYNTAPFSREEVWTCLVSGVSQSKETAP